MDLLVLAGVFVAGVGVGLSFLYDRRIAHQPDTRPCTCECHCASPSTVESSGSRDLVLLGALGLFVAVLAIGVFGGLPYIPSKPDSFPAKGKGKKGTFGLASPLTLKDGSDGSR